MPGNNPLRSIAALALLAVPGVRIGDDLMAETERGDWDDILFGGPSFAPSPTMARAARASEAVQHVRPSKALTKRQRRRQKGKGGK